MPTVQSSTLPVIGAELWQNGFFGGFLFSNRRMFSRIVSSLIFVGKMPKKTLRGKSSAKSSQRNTTKSPTYFCRQAGPTMSQSRPSLPAISTHRLLERSATLKSILLWGTHSGMCKPVVWGTRVLHPGFPWFFHVRCFRDFRLSLLFVVSELSFLHYAHAHTHTYIYIYGYSLFWGPIVYRGFGCFFDTPSFRGVWTCFPAPED